MRSEELSPCGFFVLRAPLLPFETLTSWSDGLAPSDERGLRERLRALIERPEVREALLLASPSLEEGLPIWFEEPTSERGRKIERTLLRYLARAAGRATPFGLFAGCSVGALGETTQLELESARQSLRHSRLDTDYLFALCEALGKERSVRAHLRFRWSSSLCRAAGRIRFAAPRVRGSERAYHLVLLDPDTYLEAVLERARPGATRQELIDTLTRMDPEVTAEQAAEYIDEILDSGLLESDLSPAVTGPEPTAELVAQLRQIPEGADLAARLERADQALQAIDAGGLGVAPERYRAIARDLEGGPIPVELSRLFQVDLVRSPARATLGRRVVDELLRGVSLLHRLTPRGRDPLGSFVERFVERYRDQEVPLLEALDEDTGIGFERSDTPNAEGAPLLAGLAFPKAAAAPRAWGKREALLLERVEAAQRAGRHELQLGPKDIEALAEPRPWPLPDALFARCVLVARSGEAVDRGDFQLLLDGIAGPSGALLLGRFCHGDPALKAHVERHLRAEEAMRPDAVFAEVVHLPEGRLGNVLLRPVLREYEIPYLGRSGVPRERQLTADDLFLSVVDERMVLRSRRLGREVLPRLTTAHHFAHPRNLGVYRFLGALQEQGRARGAQWSWGGLEELGALPRVVSGRWVLARARWRLRASQLERLSEAREADRRRAMQALRAELKLPRWVVLADADNELPIDLDHALAVDTLVALVKGRSQATLMELYPGAEGLCVHGPEGSFVHELVVPLARSGPPAPKPTPRPPRPARVQVFRPPGSEWLFAKLYTGTSTSDRVLAELVRPLMDQVLASGAAKGWFFIRYVDPDWHVRLRLKGEPARLMQEALPLLLRAVEDAQERGLVHRLVLDTYDREIERYGGLDGIELAEAIFQADSEAVTELLDLVRGDEGAGARWQLGLVGIDRLLADLGLELAEKHAVMAEARRDFGRRFSADKALVKQLGERYRAQRGEVEQLLAGDPAHPLAEGFQVLERRSRKLTPQVRELRAREQQGRLSRTLRAMAGSYVHMFINRLMRSDALAHELVLYDLLERAYDSRRAREGRPRG